MTIKEIKPINFLFFRTQTTINELSTFMWVAKELYREAVNLDLRITGPVHWHYFGFTGDFTKPFTLEIALPVDEIVKNYDGKFHFKRTEPFKCATAIHEGNWLEMPGSYSKLMAFIVEKGLTPLAANREIYINADFNHAAANTTEIQIGVQ